MKEQNDVNWEKLKNGRETMTNLLKCTTIFMTVGFPVIISIRWSTFDLKIHTNREN